MAVQSTKTGVSPQPTSRSILWLPDAWAARSHDTLLLLARLALGAIFVLSGYTKLTGLAAFSASLKARGVPAEWFWGPVGASVEFVGGILIILGLATRWASLLMILFVIVATAISHRFWEFGDPAQFRLQQSQFFKNLSIFGGFLYLFAVGSGRFGLDDKLRR
jgi:putative oxidoreductase